MSKREPRVPGKRRCPICRRLIVAAPHPARRDGDVEYERWNLSTHARRKGQFRACEGSGAVVEGKRRSIAAIDQRALFGLARAAEALDLNGRGAAA